jgi:adenylate cyclase 1
VILPRTIILLLLFLTAFIWVSVVLMLLLAVRLRWILWDISQSFVLRLAITVFTIVLIYTVAQVNVVSIPLSNIKKCLNKLMHAFITRITFQIPYK